MALTGWSDDNYLEQAGVIQASPVLISAWGLAAQQVATRFAVIFGQLGSSNHRAALYRNGADAVVALEADTSSSTVATSNPMSDAEWDHMAAGIAEGALEAWLNGGSKGSQFTEIERDAPTLNRVGVSTSGTAPWSSAGALAEISIWDTSGFTVEQRNALAARLSDLSGGDAPNPLDVNAESEVWAGRLSAYSSLLTPDDITDESGGENDWTMEGTLTAFASHPPVAEPAEGGGAGSAGSPSLSISIGIGI